MMLSVRDFFLKISEACRIPCSRGFWDPALRGEKPDAYFVWRLSSAEHVLQTDDEPHADAFGYTVSVFTKSEDLESVCAQIQNAAENLGACVQMLDFEDYEKDTRYYHGELSVIRYII